MPPTLLRKSSHMINSVRVSISFQLDPLTVTSKLDHACHGPRVLKQSPRHRAAFRMFTEWIQGSLREIYTSPDCSNERLGLQIYWFPRLLHVHYLTPTSASHSTLGNPS
ncbi:hypothetical protein IV203_022852 [Nitzschia inconspicua]|uniref:Uncharacterized protein n=1 Tax=Nitzschia inconspicua TaxID=303405 RepID=A0A9K3K7H4_9STRA|nr:hypothetical protein IV203_022852 [Nitzschia inconspicua]